MKFPVFYSHKLAIQLVTLTVVVGFLFTCLGHDRPNDFELMYIDHRNMFTSVAAICSRMDGATKYCSGGGGLVSDSGGSSSCKSFRSLCLRGKEDSYSPQYYSELLAGLTMPPDRATRATRSDLKSAFSRLVSGTIRPEDMPDFSGRDSKAISKLQRKYPSCWAGNSSRFCTILRCAVLRLGKQRNDCLESNRLGDIYKQ